MTKRTLTTLALSVVALTASIVPVRAAQTDLMRVNVPFAFRVAGTTLPAGDYHFFREYDGGVLRISGASGSILLITHPGALVTGSGEPTLSFHRSGGVAVLEQLRLAGDAVELVPVTSGR